MKSSFLFPTYLKAPGLMIFLGGLALFAAWTNFNYELPWLNMPKTNDSLQSIIDSSHNYTLSLALSMLLLGLIFLGFSRLRVEDEMIASIRLRSLQLSIYITVIAFLAITLFTFSFAFLTYAMWLWYGFLFLYCILFYSKILILKSTGKNNEQ